jgi:predicted lipoprotein
MDIAREERNDIRQNPMYNDNRDRAEKILSMFNHKRDFSREKLADCLKGICKDELISPIKTGQWRSL